MKILLVLVNWLLWCRSRQSSYLPLDCYDADPGSQATYHDSHKIAFSLWRKWIRAVECGILAIKKTLAKTLQIELYSVFLRKRKRKKSLIVKKKKILLS